MKEGWEMIVAEASNGRRIQVRFNRALGQLIAVRRYFEYEAWTPDVHSYPTCVHVRQAGYPVPLFSLTLDDGEWVGSYSVTDVRESDPWVAAAKLVAKAVLL